MTFLPILVDLLNDKLVEVEKFKDAEVILALELLRRLIRCVLKKSLLDQLRADKISTLHEAFREGIDVESEFFRPSPFQHFVSKLIKDTHSQC